MTELASTIFSGLVWILFSRGRCGHLLDSRSALLSCHICADGLKYLLVPVNNTDMSLGFCHRLTCFGSTFSWLFSTL